MKKFLFSFIALALVSICGIATADQTIAEPEYLQPVDAGYMPVMSDTNTELAGGLAHADILRPNNDGIMQAIVLAEVTSPYMSNQYSVVILVEVGWRS